jgi:hypothetical protein
MQLIVWRTGAANEMLYKQSSLIGQNMAKHCNKRVFQFQDLVHLRLDRLACCATELILLLHAPALDGDGVIQLVVVFVFVRRIRCLVRNGEIFETSLVERLR